jgi:hypothetical protein
MPRWTATITYIDGSCADQPFEEFSDLGRHIERGINWNAIQEIRVTLNLRSKLAE